MAALFQPRRCLTLASQILACIASGSDANRVPPLLELPVELILEIKSHLPIASHVILSQTCRALHNIIYSECGPSFGLSRGDRLQFLFCLAYNNTDVSVCETCTKFHRVLFTDTPQISYEEACILQWFDVGVVAYQQLGFKLRHRHVQLALKYERLGPSEPRLQEYLTNLLAPYHGLIRRHQRRAPLPWARHSVYPRVVTGRYLLHSVFHFEQTGMAAMLENVGSMLLCCHQDFNPDVIGRLVEALWGGPLPIVPAYYALERALKTASEAQESGIETIGACEICPTDFSVEIGPGYVTVRAWQDLGPEGPPNTGPWKTLMMRNNFNVIFGVPLPKYDYEPGSVRELYDSEKA